MCSRDPGYRGPSWPGDAKHAHLGATKPAFRPGGAGWVVLADPEAHLFCLVPG